MGSCTLTERVRGKVRHERFDDVAAALDALERRGHELQGAADAAVVGGSLTRRYQPEQQVTARLELSGPVKAGSFNSACRRDRNWASCRGSR